MGIVELEQRDLDPTAVRAIEELRARGGAGGDDDEGGAAGGGGVADFEARMARARRAMLEAMGDE